MGRVGQNVGRNGQVPTVCLGRSGRPLASGQQARGLASATRFASGANLAARSKQALRAAARESAATPTLTELTKPASRHRQAGQGGVSSASDLATGPPGPGSHPDPRGNTCESQVSLLRRTEEAGWVGSAPRRSVYPVEAKASGRALDHQRARFPLEAHDLRRSEGVGGPTATPAPPQLTASGKHRPMPSCPPPPDLPVPAERRQRSRVASRGAMRSSPSMTSSPI